jgi:hypothetical protein
MKKSYALEILDEILFSQSSAFYNELYEQNLISPDLSSGTEVTKHFSFNVVSSESSDPEKVYSRFVEYIENTKKNGIDKDVERTKFLEQYGFIIRIPNNEIKQNFRGVCEYIDLCVKQSLHR